MTARGSLESTANDIEEPIQCQQSRRYHLWTRLSVVLAPASAPRVLRGSQQQQRFAREPASRPPCVAILCRHAAHPRLEESTYLCETDRVTGWRAGRLPGQQTGLDSSVPIPRRTMWACAEDSARARACGLHRFGVRGRWPCGRDAVVTGHLQVKLDTRIRGDARVGVQPAGHTARAQERERGEGHARRGGSRDVATMHSVGRDPAYDEWLVGVSVVCECKCECTPVGCKGESPWRVMVAYGQHVRRVDVHGCRRCMVCKGVGSVCECAYVWPAAGRGRHLCSAMVYACTHA